MSDLKLRFVQSNGGAFPSLEEKTLKEVVDFHKGNSLSKEVVRPASDKTDGNPCVLYGHLYTTYQEVAQVPCFVTDVSAEDKQISVRGDVLMPASDVTPKGLATATCVMFDGALIGGDINILRPKNGFDGRYLSLAINSQKEKLYPLIVGSTVRHLHASSLKELSYCFPSIEEQQKIAEFFSIIDEKIAIEEKRLENLKRLKKGLMQKMFIDR